jgi:hypothetical protein
MVIAGLYSSCLFAISFNKYYILLPRLFSTDLSGKQNLSSSLLSLDLQLVMAITSVRTVTPIAIRCCMMVATRKKLYSHFIPSRNRFRQRVADLSSSAGVSSLNVHEPQPGDVVKSLTGAYVYTVASRAILFVMPDAS